MNEIYKDKLKIASEDELLIKAVKAVFDERAEKERPTGEGDNLALGERYRAYLEAKNIIDKAFLDINLYKTGAVKKEIINRAR